VIESETPESGYIKEVFDSAVGEWNRNGQYYNTATAVNCFNGVWEGMHNLCDFVWTRDIDTKIGIQDTFLVIMNLCAAALCRQWGYSLDECGFNRIYKEAYELWWRKHCSYGADNISTFGAKGCFVRMWDKMQRLNRLLRLKELNTLQDEATSDTFLDLINYAAISILVIDGKWPKATEVKH
jgi:hypothetical protein